MLGNNIKTNRRKILKSIGASATGIVAPSSIAVAETSTQSAVVMNNEVANSLLDAAGNPALLSTQTVVVRDAGGRQNTMTATEVQTENGTLTFAEVDGPAGYRMLPGYFRFESEESDIPSQFRSTPGNTTVTLVYEDGAVHPRRLLTENERNAVQKAVGVDAEAAMFYDESYNKLFIIAEGRGRLIVDLKQVGGESYLRRPVTSVFKSGQYSLGKIPSGGVSAQGDDCFDVYGPCTKCAVSAVACAACVPVCATVVGCAACLIITCGYSGGSCGCCALCADSIPDPENAICPN